MSDKLKHTIEQAIKDGKTAMKPRWQFIGEYIISFAVGIGAILLIWYLGSLVTYVIRANELAYLPGFGPTGWQRLFMSLPWLLILIGGLLIVATNLITRNQTTLYRQPWGITLLGIIFIALAGIAVLNQARVHDTIVRNGPPRFIRYYSPLPQAAKPIVGTVITSDKGQFVIENPNGVFTVELDQLKRTPQAVSTGEHVIILGDPEGNTIKAFGVKPFHKKMYLERGKPGAGVKQRFE